MKKSIILTAMVIVMGLLLLSGCVDKSPNNVEAKGSPEPVVSPTPAQVSQNVDLNKINELENKINSMQQQINDMQSSLDRVGLPKQSSKNLIPRIPFRIEVKEAEWQPPTVWTFKENELEIRYTDWTDIASYKIYSNNNTIKINSKKYNYYGLVLYDDYATAIYENGWIAWAKEYKVFPPKLNPETQRYELN